MNYGTFVSSKDKLQEKIEGDLLDERKNLKNISIHCSLKTLLDCNSDR